MMGTERPITSSSPEISVVIPTLPSNDHEKVVDCLRQQTHDDFETLVVNDATLGVCEARNLGIKEATADIVAFTDDDCLPPEDWIRTIKKIFENVENLVILEGPVEGGMEYNGKQKYPTCNVAVDRDTALKVGGFDERFEYWREDTEFGWRVEEYGESLFCDHMRMIHPDRARSNIKRENEQLLKRLYPKKYKKIIVPDTIPKKVNYFLWQNGFWNKINRIRYE